MRALLDRLRVQVENGPIRSADEAFQALNDAMNGLAAKVPPHYAPLLMDVGD